MRVQFLWGNKSNVFGGSSPHMWHACKFMFLRIVISADTASYRMETTWMGVSDCCLKTAKWVMVRTSYIQWDDNDVCFVIDQHS